MPNFFFFSHQEDLKIKYTKITVKFDNEGKGRARFSFKIWLEKDLQKESPELYILISNKENPKNPVILEKIDEKYNQFLRKDNFRKAAGIEDTEIEKKSKEYTISEISEFKENKELIGKKLLNPRKISLEKTKLTFLPDDMPPYVIMEKDVLLKIKPQICFYPEEINEINNIIVEFQFRIFLENFFTEKTLEIWKYSSKPWSVSIDIHKERGFKDIIHYFKKYLKYPRHIDLWINIPHDHLFIASSPVYENAIKLEEEDIKFKTYEKIEETEERKYYEKFNTMKGDYAVKISSTNGDPEFIIICVSPFRREEAPAQLREDIRDLKRESENFVKWEDMIHPLVILLAVLSIIFSFPSYEGKISSEFTELIIKAIVFGIVLWSVWLTCENIARVLGRRLGVGKITILIIIIILGFFLLIYL